MNRFPSLFAEAPDATPGTPRQSKRPVLAMARPGFRGGVVLRRGRRSCSLVLGAVHGVGHGNHVVLYWSADVDDRLEPMRVGYVNIDRSGPICEALKGITARRGATATLRFVIADRAPTCGYANVTIRISRNGKIVKTLRKAKVRENVERSVRFVVTLPRGAYRWTVSAKDIVGNRSVRDDSRSLFVE